METNFQQKSKKITLCSFDQIYTSTIPNHSSLVQSLKKVGQKMLKIESAKQQMDRWVQKDGRPTDTQCNILNRGYNIIPHNFYNGRV